MADDRPLEEPPEQVGRIEQDLADLRAMVNARLARRPTGDMELSFRATPKDGTLLCNGQAVSRTEYADLFNWATDQGLLGSLFGNGDGSTTFNVPDIRDRFLAAWGSSIAHGSTGGAASRTLTTNELPNHGHTASTTVSAHSAHTHAFSDSGSVTTSSAGGHDHSGTAASTGAHGGHASGSTNVTQSGSGVTLPGNYNSSQGGHSHSVDISSGGAHTHSATVSVSGTTDSGGPTTHSATTTVNNTGTGAAFDQRPPYLAVSVLIWA